MVRPADLFQKDILSLPTGRPGFALPCDISLAT